MTSNGWSSDYYKLPEDAEELDDLICHRDMHWHIANIFKACYRMGRKNPDLYEINKIIWFAERYKKWIKKIESK